MSLSQTSVFLDFDGTVSATDVGKHLLSRVGMPGWEEPDRRYLAGEIGSRERIEAQWSCLPRDEQLLRRVAREVPLDPGLGPLVEALRTAGAEVTVLSDGFGFYIEEALAPFELHVLANAVDFESGRVVYPHLDPSCSCASCGTCKQAPVRDARRRGRETVFVGDGFSDSKGATLADWIFAKHRLAKWCAQQSVAFMPFESLEDVRGELFGRRSSGGS